MVRVKGLGLVHGTRALSLEIGDVWVQDLGAWAVITGLGEKTPRTRRITYRIAAGTRDHDPATEYRKELRVGTQICVITLPLRIELLRERVRALTSRAETFSHSPGLQERARRELVDARSELLDAEETAAILAA